MKVFSILLLSMLTLNMAAQRRGPDPVLKEMLEQKDDKVLQDKINQLSNSSSEDDLLLLINYYNARKESDKSKTISDLVTQKFPNGKAAFDAMGERIFNERDPGENEKNYRELVKRFGTQPAFANRMDGSRYFVAITFLGKNRSQKVLEYLNMIQDTVYKTNAFSYAARESIGAKDYKLGERLIRKTFADLKGDTTHRGYDEFCRIFSELLYLNGNYEEGFPYAKRIYNKQSKTTAVGVAQLFTTYLNYLVSMGKYKEAFPYMVDHVRNGRASQLIKEKFKEAYTRVHGSENGFEDLNAGLTVELKERIKTEVAKKMINQPAYNFELRDLKGKTVKLSDYKGKIVILDFWATWCGPCKASFPMMQEAVTKFKDDNDVVFLFIHTMETSSNATKDAGDYIKDKKYSFKVLMDLKDPSGRTNAAAAGFKVNAIPAKFIIDGSGNIRFTVVGNKAEGKDAFLEEMNAMIEIAKKEKV